LRRDNLTNVRKHPAFDVINGATRGPKLSFGMSPYYQNHSDLFQVLSRQSAKHVHIFLMESSAILLKPLEPLLANQRPKTASIASVIRNILPVGSTRHQRAREMVAGATIPGLEPLVSKRFTRVVESDYSNHSENT
jgi:hypothetical protein